MQGKSTINFILKVILQCLVIGSVFCIAAILHALRYHSESLVTVLEDFVLVGAYIFVCICTVINMMRLNLLVDFMGNFYERYPKPKNIDALEKKHTNQLKICLVSCFIGVTIDVLYVVVNSDSCYAKINDTFHDEKSCGFLTPAWLPFEYKHGPTKMVLLFFQYATMVYTLSVGLTQYMVFLTALEHTTAAFDTLLSVIMEVEVTPNREDLKVQLKKVIRLHIELCRIVSHLEKMLELPALLMGIGTIINIGMLAVLMLVVFSQNGLILFIDWCFILAGVMVFSQELIDKSYQINEAIYNLPWYDMDQDSKSIIYFLLMRTQKPLRLRNAFFDMSVTTLLSIASKTYSMTTFLLQVTSNNE